MNPRSLANLALHVVESAGTIVGLLTMGEGRLRTRAIAALAAPLQIAAGFGAAQVIPAHAASGYVHSGIVPCGGGFHNYDTNRFLDARSNVYLSGSIQASYTWNCIGYGAGFGYHANYCDSFSDQGGGEAFVTAYPAPWPGVSQQADMNLGKGENCWRYSIRISHGAIGGGTGGAFQLYHAY